MRYVALDIETTGLDPDYCEILQVAAVVDDWPGNRESNNDRAIHRLPSFEAILHHEVMHGEPVALAMNAELIGLIGKAAPPPEPSAFVHVSHRNRVVPLFADRGKLFEALAGFLTVELGQPPYVAAGRNVAGFDLQFFPDYARGLFHYRVLDVSSMAMGARPALWQGERLPSCDKILDHMPAHDALLDAWDVIRTVRLLYNDHPETNGDG